MTLDAQRQPGYGASLKESEERYRALANATSEGILMHRDGVIIEANEELARIIGYPIERLLGHNVLSFLSPDARSVIAEHFNDDNESRFYDVTGVRPNGERYFVEVRSNQIAFQGRPTRVATVRDITERKNIEESLRRSEQELRSILQNMQDTYYRTDENGIITLASPSCLELLHYTVDELVGTPLADLYVNPDDRSRFLALLASTCGKVKQYSTYLRRKDGKKIWVSTNAQYHYDCQGRIAGVEGTTRDITQMIETEEKLQQALEAAKAASRAKSEFLAMMSHEIRTPMNGVLTTVQLLETTALDAEQRRYIETINSSGRLLYTLLNDVLDLSKLEAGKLQLEQENFEFNQMLENLVTLVEPLARSKGLEFRLETRTPKPLYLRGDQVRLQQILLNLLSNAVKFTEKGFVGVSVAVAASGDQYLLEAAVEDSGIGIPASEQQRLFNPFEQQDASITRRFGGTGLGLAISRDLVALMGGRIGVTSEEHCGTRFELVLPFDRATSSPCTEEADLPLDRLYCFLLVDDDTVSREAMGALLQRDGHKVTLARDGFHALELLGSGVFDYLLVDVHMPGIDGIETVKRWKHADPRGAKGTRIIALTADTRREIVARCTEAGIDFLVAKPLSKRKLYGVLNSKAGPERVVHSRSPHPADSLLDEAYLAQLAADIGMDSLGSNLELFQQVAAGVRDSLSGAWYSGDTEGTSFWAHRLAGSSRIVGLTRLADAANGIERLIRRGAPNEDVHAAIGNLLELYGTSAEALAQWLNQSRFITKDASAAIQREPATGAAE